MSALRPPRRPATGTDESGSISVGVDVDGRVVDVTVSSIAPRLRHAPLFEAAFDEALTRANGAALPPVDVPAGRTTVTARRISAPPRVPLSELVGPFLHRPHRSPVGSGGRGLIGGETGTSDNDCVSVELDRTGPGGRISVDHGWLANAVPGNVAAAIEQAFAAAYRTREDLS